MILRITKRCLTEDLRFRPADADRELTELSTEHQLVRQFVELRGQQPVGQETVEGLAAKITAYSLHAGRYRGLTWHHERAGICWLLAAGFHRSGKRDDAYAHFRRLSSDDLLPSQEDLEAAAEASSRAVATSLLAEVPGILAEADRSRGSIISGVLGGRVAVRVVKETGARAMVTLAISQRFRPGEVVVPPDWLMVVAGAFFPGLPEGQLHMAFDLGGHPLYLDEIAFCNFEPLPDP